MEDYNQHMGGVDQSKNAVILYSRYTLRGKLSTSPDIFRKYDSVNSSPTIS